MRVFEDAEIKQILDEVDQQEKEEEEDKIICLKSPRKQNGTIKE
jgi:hypothetical protein